MKNSQGWVDSEYIPYSIGSYKGSFPNADVRIDGISLSDADYDESTNVAFKIQKLNTENDVRGENGYIVYVSENPRVRIFMDGEKLNFENDGTYGYMMVATGPYQYYGSLVFDTDDVNTFSKGASIYYRPANNPPSFSIFGSTTRRIDVIREVLLLNPYTPEPEDTDPYNGLGDTSMGGGSISVPGFPGLTASSTGIIGLFAPSSSQMKALSDYMWTDFGGTGTDTTEVLKEIVEALKRTISNPLDYVIGLNIIPSQGLSIGEESVIKFGFTSSGVSMPRLLNQYFTVDCGSLSFPPLCGDTFLDYAPYSKFSIYLPYIGVKDVDANDFVGHTIGVIYHGDTVTGGVTAYITKDGSVMYQYSGCCALNIPLSADNWGNTISGAVQIATSLVAAGAIGGAAGVGIMAAKGAASVAANPSLLSPQVAHSGAVSGGAGCMAVQYPFVIREAVRFHSTAGFNKFSGYPAYYNRLLGDVSGFTTVLDVHLENVPATNVEIAEIENLLKSGVIL